MVAETLSELILPLDDERLLIPILPRTQQKLKVCFIGLYTYPLFNPDCISPFGGSEVRVAMIAKELARRGNVDVSLITFDHGQPHVEMRDGVRLISWTGWHCAETVSPQAPNAKTDTNNTFLFFKAVKSILRRTFRSFQKFSNHPALFGEIGPHSIPLSKVALYDEADADIYIIPGNAELSAELAYYCKKKQKKIILLAGSDLDFDPDIKSNSQYVTPYGVSGFLMQYTLNHANAFILQTERQRDLLHDHFQRDGIVIRNPMDLTQNFQRVENSKVILWVGKSDKVKRPELVLSLAKEFPEYNFTLIMSFSNENIHSEILTRTQSMSNVIIQTYIPFNQVEDAYAKAGLLVNTSVFEGFPNAFLQAAKYGVPILSLNVDPDGMLTEYDCGRSCKGNFEVMKSALIELMAKDIHDRMGTNGLEYIRKYHDKTVIGRQFEEALLSLFPSKN